MADGGGIIRIATLAILLWPFVYATKMNFAAKCLGREDDSEVHKRA